jgi:hypothetical protein
MDVKFLADIIKEVKTSSIANLNLDVSEFENLNPKIS